MRPSITDLTFLRYVRPGGGGGGGLLGETATGASVSSGGQAEHTLAPSFLPFFFLFVFLTARIKKKAREPSPTSIFDRAFVVRPFVRAFYTASSGVSQMASHRERAVVKVTANTSHSLSSPSV
jgi:hypothetical protein